MDYTQDWRISPEDTLSDRVTFISEMQLLKVTTKWDGCSDIWITEEVEFNKMETCYHHICDLDAFIAALQEVRAKGRTYFDGEFSVAPLRDDERDSKVAAIQQSVE